MLKKSMILQGQNSNARLYLSGSQIIIKEDYMSKEALEQFGKFVSEQGLESFQAQINAVVAQGHSRQGDGSFVLTQ